MIEFEATQRMCYPPFCSKCLEGQGRVVTRGLAAGRATGRAAAFRKGGAKGGAGEAARPGRLGPVLRACAEVRPQYSTLHLQIRVNAGDVCPGAGPHGRRVSEGIPNPNTGLCPASLLPGSGEGRGVDLFRPGGSGGREPRPARVEF